MLVCPLSRYFLLNITFRRLVLYTTRSITAKCIVTRIFYHQETTCGKIRFPEKARAHLECFFQLRTILSNADCEAWRPFSAGLPWQQLLDSMASADKEEEVALPKKARWTFPTLSYRFTLAHFSQSLLFFCLKKVHLSSVTCCFSYNHSGVL